MKLHFSKIPDKMIEEYNFVHNKFTMMQTGFYLLALSSSTNFS
jgi:hypothetical protein